MKTILLKSFLILVALSLWAFWVKFICLVDPYPGDALVVTASFMFLCVLTKELLGWM